MQGRPNQQPAKLRDEPMRLAVLSAELQALLKLGGRVANRAPDCGQNVRVSDLLRY